MPKKKQTLPPPPLDIENRENELIYLAEREAEKRLRDGTASSQIIEHYLREGSVKTRLEKEILREKKKLLNAQTENLNRQSRIEDLYAEALEVMQVYSGEQKRKQKKKRQ